MSHPSSPPSLAEIQAANTWVQPLRDELGTVLIGQNELVDRLLIGLLCNGHLLLEGVPGLAKTHAVNSLASCLNATFKRIQFTPDLLPADVLGTMVFNPKESTFQPRLGPVFGNLVLADEINRAPAKVQSALLEAMQERQVTLGETSYPLPDPFLVLATQNPIEQEGTYQLPEAQLDRFLLKLTVDYPTRDEELEVLDLMGGVESPPSPKPVTEIASLVESRRIASRIHVDRSIKEYIVDLVRATREPQALDPSLDGLIRTGSSPRATLNLTRCARALAFLAGREFVTPDDVRAIAPDVLRHRILLTFEAEAEEVTTDDVIAKLLNKLPLP
ncbi:AAA family ATPase [Sulfuriroseicoccus oceanibius]|uniref:MoxR family ATPase n=1 Tax=Sulfuriroseicoccus oceanibius TaxID=2707525 RepID=A0A6B3LBJ2_9BACT|nr:MoxR family ATPase [Sulfuriroseicoccus oceanibius]